MLEPIYPPREIDDENLLEPAIRRLTHRLAGACLWQGLGLALPDEFTWAVIPPEEMTRMREYVLGDDAVSGGLLPSLDLCRDRFVFEFDTDDPEVLHYEIGTGELLQGRRGLSIGVRWAFDIRRRNGDVLESAFVEPMWM